MRRDALFVLLAAWFLTTGSSCQTTVSGGQTTIVATDAAAAAGVGVYLVGIGIYCIANTEECFPDEEALQAQADAYQRARQTFTAGLRRYHDGDPVGLEWICLSAHQGYAPAQYFYGAYLYRHRPEQRAESVAWLSQAAAQGLQEAEVMRLQVTGGAAPLRTRAGDGATAEARPSIRTCALAPTPPGYAALRDGAR